MPIMTAYRPGTFSWTDLAAHDPRAAERFYTELFGWTAEHTRFGPAEDDIYVMLKKDGRDAAALYPMDPGQKAQGVPCAWLSYVNVASAAEAAAKAGSLGATVVADAFDVTDYGRMALLADPTGALVALWEPGNHPGAGIWGEPGTLCWNELATPDTERAAAFYGGLFGWETQVSTTGTMPYTLFLNGEERAGGMFRITPAMGGFPPTWIPYFATDDTDETVRRAEALGATAVMPPQDIPEGRIAMLHDPQGARFYVIRPARQNS